jgi:hypothetical protein
MRLKYEHDTHLLEPLDLDSRVGLRHGPAEHPHENHFDDRVDSDQ